jgi:hypothetical protein
MRQCQWRQPIQGSTTIHKGNASVGDVIIFQTTGYGVSKVLVLFRYSFLPQNIMGAAKYDGQFGICLVVFF